MWNVNGQLLLACLLAVGGHAYRSMGSMKSGDVDNFVASAKVAIQTRTYSAFVEAVRVNGSSGLPSRAATFEEFHDVENGIQMFKSNGTYLTYFSRSRPKTLVQVERGV